MSVHKRTWKNGDGSPGEAWIVDYKDQSGTRRTKNVRAQEATRRHSRPSSVSKSAGASMSPIAKAS